MLNLFMITLAAGAASTPTAIHHRDETERWERRLRRRVSELHALPGGADRDWSGDVTIRFTIGADGRPENVVLQRSSGHPVFDRAARRLVRLLGPVGRTPPAIGKDRGVVLNLSYGAEDHRSAMKAEGKAIAGLQL